VFEANIYVQRRNRLKGQLKSGVILFLGNEESPMNFLDNPYRFRQDSSFLYFFGLDSPGLAGVIDVDEDKDIIFGTDVDLNDIIWMGPQPLLKDRAMKVGISETAPPEKLDEMLKRALQRGKKVHFLPPYRPETFLKIEKLLGIQFAVVKEFVSVELIKAVVEQRSIKIKEEIEEIEVALNITYQMQTAAMKMAKPGVNEKEIAGKMEGIALSHGCPLAFPMILTINGQILHNHYQGNILKEGQLLVNDSGSASPRHYPSDITRTVPVGGKFAQQQKEIYELVLKGQETAIQSIAPGIKYRDVHLKVAKTIAYGLKDLGLLKGNVEEAFKEGAHALFFPHGTGHMLGLDVHDMESLGEDFVGYDETTQRSDQFGFAQLRLGRELHPGFVLTVEPGIYFIPALIDKWKKEKEFTQFINYDEAEQYRNFGGIRIEDDVLVTDSGSRVLGKPIPKKVEEVEEITAKD
jgi:Xaa-Pro aminopeptidase